MAAGTKRRHADRQTACLTMEIYEIKSVNTHDKHWLAIGTTYDGSLTISNQHPNLI